MTTKERLLAYLTAKGMNAYQFEMKAGLSQGYIKNMREGFGAAKLEKILAAAPELNRDWLLYEQGEMLNPSVSITQGDHATAIGNGSGNTTHYNSDAVIAILNEQLRVKDRQIEGLIQALQK